MIHVRGTLAIIRQCNEGFYDETALFVGPLLENDVVFILGEHPDWHPHYAAELEKKFVKVICRLGVGYVFLRSVSFITP